MSRRATSRDDGNATRLRVNPKVQDRLAELQAEVAKQTKVTVESLLDELENARQRADSLRSVIRSGPRNREQGADFRSCWCRRWKCCRESIICDQLDLPVPGMNLGPLRAAAFPAQLSSAP